MKVSEFLFDLNELIMNKLKADIADFLKVSVIEKKCGFNENELRHKINRNSVLKPHDVERLEEMYEIDIVEMTMRLK